MKPWNWPNALAAANRPNSSTASSTGCSPATKNNNGCDATVRIAAQSRYRSCSERLQLLRVTALAPWGHLLRSALGFAGGFLFSGTCTAAPQARLMGFFSKIKQGLVKTKQLLNTDVRDLFKSE